MSEPFQPWLAELEGAAGTDAARARRAFATLHRAHFHAHRAASKAAWDRLFDAVLAFIGHDDDRVSQSAEHFAWAILWHELGPPFDSHTRDDQRARLQSRIPRLLDALARTLHRPEALMRHADSLVHVSRRGVLGSRCGIR